MAKKRATGPPPPDAEYVTGLWRHKEQEADEAKVRRLAAEMRTLTEMEHQVRIPQQYRATAKEVRTPFTRDTWLRVTAALTHNDPVAHCEPRDETGDAKRAANLAERWEEATRLQMDDDLGENVPYESAKALVRDTESVIKVVHKPDAWAHFPRREKGEDGEAYLRREEGFRKGAGLPLAWRVVDRLTTVFGDEEWGDGWVIEHGEYPKAYLGRRYEMVRDEEGRLRDPRRLLGGKPRAEGEPTGQAGSSRKMEYFDADWWHVVIDGEDAPGFPKPNPYAPHLPYFRAKVLDPVLISLRFLVPAMDELLTMKMNWAYLGAYPNPVLKPVPNTQQVPMEPEGADGQALKWNWIPGKALQVPYGYEAGFLSPPPVGQDLNELVVILRSLIDIAGVPSLFRGTAMSDQSGYLANQMIAAASLTFKILGKLLERQLSQAAMFKWHVVRTRIKRPVPVLAMARGEDNPKAWLSLQPKGATGATTAGIDRLARITYAVKPVLPTDEQARAMIGNQAYAAGLLSKETVLERYYMLEDPQGEVDRQHVERALESEPLVGIETRRALEEAGIAEPQQPNPASQLVGPNGAPLLPRPPGQMAGGLPAIPGLTQPMLPAPPERVGGVGGRAAGSFPGRPGGVPGGQQGAGG